MNLSDIDFSELFTTLAAKGTPSIVRIGRNKRGSGVVVGDGKVLTNAHNLRGETVTITFADGANATGSVLGADLDGDLAVVGVETPAGSAIAWAPDGAGPRLGQSVFSLVQVGEDSARLTAGYVSSVGRSFRGPRRRRIGGGFEHTAPLGPGSSGGAVLDSEGRLLGINTHRLGDGFYLAVPADETLRQRVDDLAQGKTPARVRLGVGVAPSHVARKLRASVGLPDRSGLLVRAVEDGSPAATAGIQRGDLLVRIGSTELADSDNLLDALAHVEPGSTVEVGLVRGAEDLTVSVTFAASESSS